MSARMLGGIVLIALALAACGEKPQLMDDKSAKKWDEPAWAASNTAEPAFSAGGWKSTGDKAAWEQRIRQRGQAQNDYAR